MVLPMKLVLCKSHPRHYVFNQELLDAFPAVTNPTLATPEIQGQLNVILQDVVVNEWTIKNNFDSPLYIKN